MSCPDCFSGHVHDGTPKGTVTKLHGLDCYVAEPAEGKPIKGIIVVIPDAFGWEFVNNRILADHYADKGSYRVYLPEFMDGHAAPVWTIATMSALFKTSSLTDWLTKPYHIACTFYAMGPFMLLTRPSKSYPLVHSFFAALRATEAAHLPLFAAGFCWGGKHAVLLAHGARTPDDSQPLIDAAFTGHPSMLSLPSDIDQIILPVSFAIGDKDIAIKPRDIETIRRIVEAKPEAERGEVKTYEGAGHGFCVRADHVLEDAEEQARMAEEQCLGWFDRHCGKGE